LVSFIRQYAIGFSCRNLASYGLGVLLETTTVSVATLLVIELTKLPTTTS